MAEPDNNQKESGRDGITRLVVGGFKSISEEQSVEIRPLTIFAGANSSGKSSAMQPLLLLKQTLEAPYDPGALLLNGPNVRFTLVDQMLSRVGGPAVDGFHVGIEMGANGILTTYFGRGKSKRIDIEQMAHHSDKKNYRLHKGMPQKEIHAAIASIRDDLDSKDFKVLDKLLGMKDPQFILTRNRCFFALAIRSAKYPEIAGPFDPLYESELLRQYISKIIHLPGLRGSPERTYPVTAVGREFPGTFEKYVASIIGQWQTDNNHSKLAQVNRDLARLGLAGGVRAEPIDDTQVELLVTRFSRSNDTDDMVSIADVGLGISQTLPVIVALHVAEPGQLIYLEQPELHLHPRAQSAMAEVLADAALQGKRLVVETHSSLLLLGIQTLVAEGKLPPELVKLHWFKLRDDGSTQIISADLDEAGAFGDWPEDFAQVVMDSENRYLDAAEAKLKGN
jgi:predicted ATPase